MIARLIQLFELVMKQPVPGFGWRGKSFLSMGVALVLGHWLAQIPEPPVIEILSPAPGQALQGGFPVRVTVLVPGFGAGVLSFRYTGDPTGTWFELARFQDELEDAELVVWDTTALTDGNYDLQLVITREDEDPLTVTVPGLRVRNYSLIETNTPAPTITGAPDSTATPEPTATSRPAPVRATPTPLPPNSAEIRQEDISASLLDGLLASLITFGAVGLLLLIRAVSRR